MGVGFSFFGAKKFFEKMAKVASSVPWVEK